VWRIRRREKASVIEVFRVEESGHGDILSQEFLQWRNRSPEEKARDSEAKEGRGLDGVEMPQRDDEFTS